MGHVGDGEEREIDCLNSVDAEATPQEFRYVTESVYPQRLTEFITTETPKLAVDVYLRKTVGKGWGVYAKGTVPAKAFVCAYVGEYLDSVEADRRLKLYDTLNQSHALLIVREVLPSGAALRTNIDATSIGNLARFFNHSCDGGNLIPEIERTAEQDDELTFAYGDTTTGQGHLCLCGASECLGFLPNSAVDEQ